MKIEDDKIEHSLLDKCLEFTRDMVMLRQSLTFTLKLDSGLNFSYDYHEKKSPNILEEPKSLSKTKVNVMKTKTSSSRAGKRCYT